MNQKLANHSDFFVSSEVTLSLNNIEGAVARIPYCLRHKNRKKRKYFFIIDDYPVTIVHKNAECLDDIKYTARCFFYENVYPKFKKQADMQEYRMNMRSVHDDYYFIFSYDAPEPLVAAIFNEITQEEDITTKKVGKELIFTRI